MRRCHGIAGFIGCSHGPALDACQEARKENQTHSVIHLFTLRLGINIRSSYIYGLGRGGDRKWTVLIYTASVAASMVAVVTGYFRSLELLVSSGTLKRRVFELRCNTLLVVTALSYNTYT